MLGIVGLVLGAGGGWTAWWAFQKAAEDGSYGWMRPVAIIIGLVGVFLLFIFIRKWWIED